MTGALSAAAESLLPRPTDAPRCADHQRHLGVDPCGTAIDTELLILVDVPRPWPAEMSEHPLFGGRGPVVPTAGGRARLVAVCPPADDEPPRLRVYWRQGGGVMGAGHSFIDAAGLDALLDRLTHEPPTPGWTDPTVPAATDLVLVCTHGSRDQCCGNDGTRLAQALEQVRPHLTVERTSHLGGHRFSPTVMTLANGRMWAAVDSAMVMGILDRTAEPAAVADHCRGWWGATEGPAQVAERAVFVEQGWGLDDNERQVVVDVVDPHLARVTVSWPGGRRQVDVAAVRDVPVIACRSAGGLPAKPSVEYAVVAPPSHG